MEGAASDAKALHGRAPLSSRTPRGEGRGGGHGDALAASGADRVFDDSAAQQHSSVRSFAPARVGHLSADSIHELQRSLVLVTRSAAHSAAHGVFYTTFFCSAESGNSGVAGDVTRVGSHSTGKQWRAIPRRRSSGKEEQAGDQLESKHGEGAAVIAAAAVADAEAEAMLAADALRKTVVAEQWAAVDAAHGRRVEELQSC
jgi:hypothetical protein